MKFIFDGPHSTAEWHDAEGRTIRSKILSWEEISRYDIFQEQPSPVGGTTGHIHVMMLHSTSDTGYVVPAWHSRQPLWPALQVRVVNDETDSSRRRRKLSLIAGFAQRRFLASLSFEATARQTPRQTWLSQVWSATREALNLSLAMPTSSDHFVTIRELDVEETDIAQRRKLFCMLMQRTWDTNRCTIEARRTEVEEMGLIASSTSQGFDKTLRDQGITCNYNRLA